MSDFGIKVSFPDTDAAEAEQAQLLLSSRYPFAKLDTQKEISFKNYLFRFVSNPPDPVGTSPNFYRETQVYSTEHGYDYIPAVWALVSVVTPVTGAVFYQDYFQDGGVISAKTAFDDTEFYVRATNENVTFHVNKYLDTVSGGIANNLIGCTLRVRLFVFAEDIGV